MEFYLWEVCKFLFWFSLQNVGVSCTPSLNDMHMSPRLFDSCILFPETGGICIAPRPSEEGAEIIPAMAMRPFFGIVPVLMDENVS